MGGIENDGNEKNNGNVEEFPGMRARLALEEIDNLLPNARRMVGTGRLNANMALKNESLNEANASELFAKYDAMENLCNVAESVARGLRADPLNRLLLNDAETAKSQLEAALVEVGR